MAEHRVVGTNVPRKEALPKLLGQAQYVDDMTLPGMLHGATVRSTIARGTHHGDTFAPHIAWDEFIIVTANDIPGRNMVPMFLEDQPLLAEDASTIRGADRAAGAPGPRAAGGRGGRGADRLRRAAGGVHARGKPEQDPVIWTYDDTTNTFKRFHLEHGDSG